MAIDGIRRGGRPPSIERGSVDARPGVSTQFEIASRMAPTGAAQSTAAATLLEQVRQGTLNLESYLDARVGEAVQHLQGSLTQEQMSFIQTELRAQLKDDPVLIDLVRRATGRREEPEPA